MMAAEFFSSSTSVMPSPIATAAPIFYRPPSKYHSCCCHVKTVATILGVMSIVSACVLITYSFYNLFDWSHPKNVAADQPTSNFTLPWAMSLVFSLLSLIFTCIMFYGLHRQYPMLLLAHMVVHVLTLLFWFAILIVKLLFVVRSRDRLRLNGDLPLWILTLLLLLAYVILQMYFFYISYKTFMYVKEKRTSVVATEMLNSSGHWATQSSFMAVSAPTSAHINGTYPPRYYNVITPQQAATIQMPPPAYGSWQMQNLNETAAVVPTQFASSSWIAATPPPTYSTPEGNAANK